MVNALSVSTDRLAKVVLVGSAGAGKSGIVKAVAEKYVHSSVRAGGIGEGNFFRTEFFWPEPMIDGGQLRVRGAVPRFDTGPEDHSQLRSSVEWIIAQIVIDPIVQRNDRRTLV
jgi:GTPase SAR1 family protein